MKTYIRTYPVIERKSAFLVKGVTYKQMKNPIDHTMKKSRWGVEGKTPIAFGVYELSVSYSTETVEQGEFIYE